MRIELQARRRSTEVTLRARCGWEHFIIHSVSVLVVGANSICSADLTQRNRKDKR